MVKSIPDCIRSVLCWCPLLELWIAFKLSIFEPLITVRCGQRFITQQFMLCCQKIKNAADSVAFLFFHRFWDSEQVIGKISRLLQSSYNYCVPINNTRHREYQSCFPGWVLVMYCLSIGYKTVCSIWGILFCNILISTELQRPTWSQVRAIAIILGSVNHCGAYWFTQVNRKSLYKL